MHGITSQNIKKHSGKYPNIWRHDEINPKNKYFIQIFIFRCIQILNKKKSTWSVIIFGRKSQIWMYEVRYYIWEKIPCTLELHAHIWRLLQSCQYTDVIYTSSPQCTKDFTWFHDFLTSHQVVSKPIIRCRIFFQVKSYQTYWRLYSGYIAKV